MDVETTGKNADRSNGSKAEMNGKKSPSPVPAAARTLRIAGVQLKIVGETLNILKDYKVNLDLTCVAEGRESCRVSFNKGDKEVFDVQVKIASNIYQAGTTLVFLRVSQGSAVITTRTQNDASQLLNYLHCHVSGGQKRLNRQSVFSLRTEEGSAKQYFQFYGYLSQQQNMMQDYVRTATYQAAIMMNSEHFRDKVILDVGAGTGILSFFAIQAGARKVYCVEASSMSVHCQQLIKDNNLSDKMTVIAGKVEEVELPEKVDVIISEPMGYMLYNERMLESFLHAKKWLRPRGRMYPCRGILYVAPFNDEQLYLEQCGKAFFWSQTSFYGIDLSGLRTAALDEYFRQPILDAFHVDILMADPVGHLTDFTKAQETDLHKVTVPFTFSLLKSGLVHGLAFWFDVAFCGKMLETVWLSTSPMYPLTHWYQIRCLFLRPMFGRIGQQISGTVVLTANERQSYDVDIQATLVGEGVKVTGSYDLKNPNFRYMSMPPAPPGSLHVQPTESYFHPERFTTAAQKSIPEEDLSLVTSEPQQVTSPMSAEEAVVVSSTITQPVMAVHASSPVVNGVSVMNGGLLSPVLSKGSPTRPQAVHGLPSYTQPLLRSPPPGNTHLQSPAMLPHSAGMMQQVGGTHYPYGYTSSAAAMGTVGNPHFTYKFHQVYPNVGTGQGGRTQSPH